MYLIADHFSLYIKADKVYLIKDFRDHFNVLFFVYFCFLEAF